MNEGAMQERIVLCRTPDEIQALLERFHMVLPSLKRGKAFRAACLLYTSPSPRDIAISRMPSSA